MCVNIGVENMISFGQALAMESSDALIPQLE